MVYGYGLVLLLILVLGLILSRLMLVIGEWLLGKSFVRLENRYGAEIFGEGLDSGRSIESYKWDWRNLIPRGKSLRDRLIVYGSDMTMVLGVLMVFEEYASSGSYWLASSTFVMALVFGISYVTDVKERYIFDWATIPGIVYVGFVSMVFGDQVWWSYVGAGGLVVLMLGLSMILTRKMMGFGDIYLYVLVAMYVGLLGIVPVILASSILGLVYGLVLYLRKGKSEYFAFGPFIIWGTMIVVLFGITM